MPQTVFDLGDTITSRLKLGVTPDGTTVVTVAVTKPDGTTQTVVGPTGPTGGDEWVCQWEATQHGDYVAVWDVNGTGASVTTKVYPVRALPVAKTRVVWAPSLAEVADHIPRLTVDTVTPGSAVEYGTFTGDTTPTDEQAQRHIDSAVTVLTASVSTLDASLEPLARSVAALRAAAQILRAYYRDTADLSAAAALDARADKELTRLTTANTAVTGDEPGLDIAALYSFPSPVSWGDVYL